MSKAKEIDTGDVLHLPSWQAGVDAAAKVVERFTTAQHIAQDIKDGHFPGQTDPRVAMSYAIRAIPPPAALPSPWRAMASAPKDGTAMWLDFGDSERSIGCFETAKDDNRPEGWVRLAVVGRRDNDRDQVWLSGAKGGSPLQWAPIIPPPPAPEEGGRP